MLIDGSNKLNNLGKMKSQYELTHKSSILLGKANKNEIKKYGIAKVKKNKQSGGLGFIEQMIEKPSLNKAPSNLFAVGRYVFSYELISYLSRLRQIKKEKFNLQMPLTIF